MRPVDGRLLHRCFPALMALLLYLPGAAAACQSCHSQTPSHAGQAHEGLACGVCHGGDERAADRSAAHEGLQARPGELANAARGCGLCHAERAGSVPHNPMAHGRGMVAATRQAWGEPWADSLLDKLCVGCHLVRERDPALPPAANRGGGCLACHWGGEGIGLTARVGDERCFGCHARSGRIALNYAGLAEVDPYGQAPVVGRLADGRSVRKRPADRHHDSGMACIDCHTAEGLMGADGLDIACNDCHAQRRPGKRVNQWTAAQRRLAAKIPFPWDEETLFAVTARRGTPLWNVHAGADGWILYGKLDGLARPIPPWTEADHPLAPDHATLECATCHSQWAPQCYGCHLRYAPEQEQWDHRLGRVTPGRWVEERWDVESGLPAMGVSDAGRIVPVVPGMILSAEHPDWAEPVFRRRFAALSPHTTGKARACGTCHGEPQALGLGSGSGARHSDGLTVDAWIGRSGKGALRQQGSGVMPLAPEQIEKLLVPIPPPGK